MGLGEIIVVVPTERESLALRASGVAVEHCGVGMAECAASVALLIAERRPSMMILAGIAGTYTDALAVGETVVVASEIVADLGRFSADFVPLFQKEYASEVPIPGFRNVKSNTVNTAGWTANGAEIENMEGAAFLAVCARMGVRALEVRTISNRVGDPITPPDLDLATDRLAEAVEKILAIV